MLKHYTMLRLAYTSAILPYAVRAIASPKIRSSSISNAIVSLRHFHSSTDSFKLAHRKIADALKSKIKSHELALIRSRGAPENLPFTIEDDPNYCHVMLRRDLGEEKMEVTVNPVYEEEIPDAERKKAVYINVSLSKEAKGTMEFGAYVSADKIVMHRIAFSKPNSYDADVTYYEEEDGDLQNLWREFVECRGIEKSTVGFLYDYMVEKRKSTGTVWNPPNPKKTEFDNLKIAKKFVEEW